MRQWLEQAEVVDKGKWLARPERLQTLLGGASIDELEVYAG
jgi:hypothetical protein